MTRVLEFMDVQKQRARVQSKEEIVAQWLMQDASEDAEVNAARREAKKEHEENQLLTDASLQRWSASSGCCERRLP